MEALRYTVQIGSAEFTNQGSKKGGIQSIRSVSSIGSINEAELVLPMAVELSVTIGDEIQISFGVQRMELVYTGIVSEIRNQQDLLFIESVSSLSALAVIETNSVFEQKSAGSIVGDLCKPYDISTGLLDDGLEYPVYIIDNKHSILNHIEHLAIQNGCKLYTDEKDKLSMTSSVGSMTHVLVYGKNILSYDYSPKPHGITGIDLFGESPVGQGQSKEAYSWLSQKEVKGSSGASTNKLQISDPTLKDLESVEIASQGFLETLEPKGKISVVTSGNPKTHLLDQLIIKNTPSKYGEGHYECIEVSHSYSQLGFISKIIGREM